MEQPIMNAEAARAAAAPAPTQPPAAAPIASPAVSSKAGNVVPLGTKPPASPQGKPTLTLGQIKARIAPLSIDAAGLAELGFPVVATEKGSKFYHEADFAAMCHAASSRLLIAAEQQKAA